MLNWIAAFGILSLTYTAYIAAQVTTNEIPLKITMQTLASMLITMAGVVSDTKFIDIKYTGHKNFDTIINRPSLYIFNHPGRFVYPRTASL